MDYVVRKIHRPRWDPISHIDGIRADALKCLQTRQDQLSVWECHNTHKDIEEAALAMAAAMDHLATFYLVLLKKKDLDKDSKKWVRTLGDTPIVDLQNRHIHLLELNIDHINKLARRIAEQTRDSNGLCYRFRQKEVKNLLIKAIQAGRLNIGKLKPDVRKKIP